MYSITYILLFVLYAAMAFYYRYADEKRKAWLKAMSILVFISFFGFRGFVGDDWLIYYPTFDNMYNDSIANAAVSISFSRLEPGYTVLQAVCKFIYPNYHFFIFICCVLQCILLYNFFRKRTDNIPFSFMVFLCMSGLGLEINLLRNSISLFICLNALDFLKERKPVQYFGLCLLAMSIHISAIVFIPMYFFLHKRIPFWIYVLVFISATAFLLAQISFIGPILLYVASYVGDIYVELVRNYIEGEMAAIEGIISIGLVERVLTGVLIICYYNKLVDINKENTMFINAFLIYFLSFALLHEFFVASRRVALLFAFSYWILWPNLLKCFAYRGNKMIFAIFLIFYGTLKIHFSMNEPKFEYDNIIFNAKSYEERYTIYMMNKKD